MQLFLVRHGETEWNRARRIQGHSDSPLTALGKKQAIAAGKILAEIPFAAAYVSDAPRAQETARLIIGDRDLRRTSDHRLREMHYGVLEGLTWPQIEARHPEAHKRLSETPGAYSPDGGESREIVVARALESLEEIAAKHPNDIVLVISHGGLISGFLRHVLSIPFGAPSGFFTANCGINRFEHVGGRFRLQVWGMDQHLRGLEP